MHTIADLKEYFNPGEINKITDELIFNATVIANDKHGNFYKKIILQDETGGIVFLLNRHDLFTTFEEGREISISAKGLYISDYNGTIQVGGSPTIDKKGNPRLGQLDDRLIADHLFHGKQIGLPAAKEVTIIELGPAEVSTGCVTAIYGVYRDNKQLHIRTEADLNLAGTRCKEVDTEKNASTKAAVSVTSLNEDFSSNVNYEPVSAANWENTTNVSRGRTWQAREHDGNIYAQATAYRDSAPKVDAWLVTPKLDFSAGLQISFKTATSFNTHQGLEILVSTDFTGAGDPSAATWAPLIGAVIADSSSEKNKWVPSGNVSLASYSGDGFIAFRYTGSSADKASTFRVDDIVISKP